MPHPGCKCKPVPVEAWKGPEVQELEAPRSSIQLAHEGGKVVSPMHWLPSPLREDPGTHFC
jgi:hypothetical protein